MILVYAEKESPRLAYTLDYVFNSLLGISYTLETDFTKATTYEGPKLSYSTNNKLDCCIEPSSLLFETHISSFEVPLKSLDEMPILFPNNDSFLSFDIFSAVFYMISRYEEYLPHQKDEHDRFPATQSLAAKYNFLHKPIVNLWIQQLELKLHTYFPELKFIKRRFEFINTFDIDNAYAYKGKPLWRKIGALGKALIRFEFKEFSERISVWFGMQNDPYDTYDFILQQHKKFDLNSVVFFLLGNYGSFDKNLPYKSKAIHALVKRLKSSLAIGIHPSYASNSDDVLLGKEVNRLNRILGEEVNCSRQHYLKLQIPMTYKKLINAGINSDYSLGFADDWGFRAGTCVPFYFFDLEKNKETPLMIYPTIVMESTLRNYLNKNPNQAIIEFKKAIDEVFNVQGTFISLWHNESLSENYLWQGWKDVYIQMLEYISEKVQ